MYTFMLFLNQELVSSISVTEDKSYTLGTDHRNSDIFVPVYNPEQTIEVTFSLQDQAIIFTNLGSNLITPDGQIVLIRENYVLPQAFGIKDTEINFSIAQDLDSNFNYFKLVENQTVPENFDEPELIFEELANTESVAIPEVPLSKPQQILMKLKLLWNLIKPTSVLQYFIYSALGVLLLVLIVVGIIYLKSNAHKAALATLATHKITIKSVLINYPNLTINKTGGGIYAVSGILNNEQDLNKIKQQLSHYKVKYNVLTQSELQIIIAKLNLPKNIDVKFQNNKILVTGITPDTDVIANIYETISDAIHMDIEIDTSRVFQTSNIESDFDTVQNNPAFLGNIQITKDYPTQLVKVGGYIDKSSLGLLTTLLGSLEQKYLGILQIKNNVLDRNSINLNIQEVYLNGSNSYIVVNQNQKVFIDGRIGEWILTGINSKQITFKNSATNYILNMSLDQLIPNNVNVNNLLESKINPATIMEEEHRKLGDDKKARNDIISYVSNVKDENVKKFLQSQLDELNTKIIIREHQLAFYSKKIHN